MFASFARLIIGATIILAVLVKDALAGGCTHSTNVGGPGPRSASTPKLFTPTAYVCTLNVCATVTKHQVQGTIYTTYDIYNGGGNTCYGQLFRRYQGGDYAIGPTSLVAPLTGCSDTGDKFAASYLGDGVTLHVTCA